MPDAHTGRPAPHEPVAAADEAKVHAGENDLLLDVATGDAGDEPFRVISAPDPAIVADSGRLRRFGRQTGAECQSPVGTHGALRLPFRAARRDRPRPPPVSFP